MSGAPPQWNEVNRQMWDERVPIHVSSEFYDVAGFKAGRPAIQPFEIDELGPLGGLRLVHLQCHFGLDTLDLVRLHPALEAVGLDFSRPAVEAATSLASEIGLSDRARFVEADVAAASTLLGTEAFDIVYTGKGALCWLADLDRWASECWQLLRPGGWLYICEFHPVAYALDEDTPTVKYDYFQTEPWADDMSGTYADRDAATVNNLSYSWNHPLPELFGALLARGFQLRFFHEWDYTLFELNSWLVKGSDGNYRWPSDRPARLPMMYSLKAFKPTASG